MLALTCEKANYGLPPQRVWLQIDDHGVVSQAHMRRSGRNTRMIMRSLSRWYDTGLAEDIWRRRVGRSLTPKVSIRRASLPWTNWRHLCETMQRLWTTPYAASAS